MSILASDLHKAIIKVWNDSALNATFRSYWKAADTTEFPVIHDQEAGPAQPFPYCVFNQDSGSTISRMSNRIDKGRFEIYDVPWEFHVHSRSFVNVNKSAKQIAIELVEDIIKVFGGHPTSIPVIPVLDNGAVLQSQYESDYGTRDGDEEWSWILRYRFLMDVPVAA